MDTFLEFYIWIVGFTIILAIAGAISEGIDSLKGE